MLAGPEVVPMVEVVAVMVQMLLQTLALAVEVVEDLILEETKDKEVLVLLELY